ncbi:MAG: glycoside hydrolase family 3 C-terminal domain-containing protein [Clostridiales bacterium]|nr:glycoside hydrolase family 3 C-terminal domain-containing protein [Clostridiales bacterium]
MIHYHANPSPEVTASERSHSDSVRRIAGECMVLLENDGVLPLSGPQKVALYGNGARATVKGGTGSGEVNSRYSVSVEQGLEEAGFEITTKQWLAEQDRVIQEEFGAYMADVHQRAEAMGIPDFFVMFNEHFIPKALAPFQQAEGDLAIYVLGRNSGEGSDRYAEDGDYELTQAEGALRTALGRSYTKVIVLLNLGGEINAATLKAIPGISAMLLISQSGNMGGHIVADVLLGKSIPSGRLTDTWAEKYMDYPSSATFSHNNGNWNDEYYTDGIFVGYRYFDTFNVKPLYPFGYGLNYTTFTMETLGASADEKQVSVTVKVTNTGAFSGREVVQVYGSAPRAGLEKPMQVLCGFGKTRLLQPGQCQELKVSFDLTNLESYDPAKAAYVLEAGEYVIRVGVNSRNTHVAALVRLDETVETKKVKNICPLDEEFEEISCAGVECWKPENEDAEKAAAPVFAISAAKVPTVTVAYAGEPEPFAPSGTDHMITLEEVRDGKYTMEQLVSQLSVEEMAEWCVGAARDNENVIGSASKAVPGAAGETSLALAYRGVRDMINADGPAGLRLIPHFRTDAEGKLLPGGSAIGGMAEDFAPKQEGDVDYYQYCTAIPIAWLLASSWDLELIEKCGDIVGAEMETFGVRVWLAPGMNIHRNPLCGRNFEYYSEDPLLSGLCAAADVRGVQKHPGVGTSIKHYFANNQEDNRMYCNAHIKERAIREIYLRNFGICIEASQPMTIMTSYNLINGVHGANCYDSITCYAREECGFQGYVMTDWFTSNAKVSGALAKPNPKYPCSSSPLCVYAGNDVQMPGSEGNIEDIITAVKDGSLKLGYLQRSAAKLLEVDLKCGGFPEAGPYIADKNLRSFMTQE